MVNRPALGTRPGLNAVRTLALSMLFGAITAGVILLACPALADQNPQQEWQGSFTLYVWGPTIKGLLNFNIPASGGGGGGGGAGPAAPSLGVTLTPSQYVPKLASTFMGYGETHNRYWGLYTDLIYMNLGISNAGVSGISGPGGIVTVPINANMNARLTSTIWTLGATFHGVETPRFSADALAGGRYAYVPIRLTWAVTGPLGVLDLSGTHFQSASLWDAIVGAKGKVDLGRHWFVPYYVDVGTGEAHLTWQGIGGFGYAADHGQKIQAVYRNLYYDMGTQGLLHNINFGGPAIGYTFKV